MLGPIAFSHLSQSHLKYLVNSIGDHINNELSNWFSRSLFLLVYRIVTNKSLTIRLIIYFPGSLTDHFFSKDSGVLVIVMFISEVNMWKWQHFQQAMWLYQPRKWTFINTLFRRRKQPSVFFQTTRDAVIIFKKCVIVISIYLF